jgi:hypothetical protein
VASKTAASCCKRKNRESPARRNVDQKKGPGRDAENTGMRLSRCVTDWGLVSTGKTFLITLNECFSQGLEPFPVGHSPHSSEREVHILHERYPTIG